MVCYPTGSSGPRMFDILNPAREPQVPQALLNQAAILLANGQAPQAMHLAVQALRRYPYSADLCNLAGACAASLGQMEEAEAYWRRTLVLHPGASQTYFNLGLLHAQCGLLLQAEPYYRNAVAIDPGNLLALHQLAALLATILQNDEAAFGYRRLLALDPGHTTALSNLGVLLVKLRHEQEAKRCYRSALALDPHNAKVLSNLGILLARDGRLEEAGFCHRRSLALDAGVAETHTNLGLLLEQQQRLEEAEQCHRRAVVLKVDEAAVHANLANLLARVRRESEAESCYHQSLALDPGSAIAHSALGVLLANLERDPQAEVCFRRALAIRPDYALARLNLGFLLLRQGRYREAWPYHEARYHPDLPDQPLFPYPVTAPLPQWRGESLMGRSLLVWTEQGYGDEIQFCRYIPLLKRQGAARITLICKPLLKALMENLAGVDEVVAANDIAYAAAEHDYWTYPLSIPLYCQTTLESIPREIPYLRAPTEYLARWSALLPKTGFRVGLVWKGNPLHANDSYRSLPDLALLAPLWEVPGVSYVSLQKGQGQDQARNPPARQPLLHLGDNIVDFADAAAIIAQLDLVICVDTAVTHLAGAIGKACWLLLPAYRCDWRWLRGRDDSPWYPEVMRLFRQRHDHEWGPVVQQLKTALTAIVARHTKPRLDVPCVCGAMEKVGLRLPLLDDRL